MARQIRVRKGMRSIGGVVYHQLGVFSTKARAVKDAEEYRVWGYGAKVIKTKEGWAIYRTWDKTHPEIKKPKSWWKQRGYVVG